ncbi:hypothetical protein K439DRAFT_1335733 [Ramaria rubella]|nr:hypothetical protein K439DRAFT_1335733 [Ramaria rubella]
MEFPVNFDEIEEGELGVDGYEPAFGFSGDSEVSQYPPQPRVSSPSPSPLAAATNKTTVFRLIVLNSSVFPKQKSVAVLDGRAEVSLGRDVTSSARVRLKEMAVSKFHASIYWDGSRREWGIVDMGSVHGTFVRSARDASTSTRTSEPTLGTRLSEPRKASMPRALRHLDQVTIGGTTFLVHEHITGRPCPDCAIESQAEIPLFSTRTLARSVHPSDDLSRKRKHTVDKAERNPKKAMLKLKSSLMSRHVASEFTESSYKDRSALRRELHPEPRIPLPPPQTPPDPQILSHIPLGFSPPPPPAPPQPVGSDNIGHKLLLLQGWNPGTALGEDPDTGLTEPLNLSANTCRAGLGSLAPAPRRPSQPPGDWRDDMKQRRWDEVRSK